MNIRLTTAAAMLAIAACHNAAPAREAADFFVGAPPEVAGIFDANTRLDMLDYFRSGLSTPSTNALGRNSRITALSPTSVSVEVSPTTSVQLALVEVKNDTLVAVIETVATPIPDSGIRFYSTDWQKVAEPAMPGMADFVDPAKRKEAAKAEVPPLSFVTAVFDPQTQLFRFTDTSGGYYHASEMPELRSYTVPEIAMKFNGKKFVKAK